MQGLEYFNTDFPMLSLRSRFFPSRVLTLMQKTCPGWEFNLDWSTMGDRIMASGTYKHAVTWQSFPLGVADGIRLLIS